MLNIFQEGGGGMAVVFICRMGIFLVAYKSLILSIVILNHTIPLQKRKKKKLILPPTSIRNEQFSSKLQFSSLTWWSMEREEGRGRRGEGGGRGRRGEGGGDMH